MRKTLVAVCVTAAVLAVACGVGFTVIQSNQSRQQTERGIENTRQLADRKAEDSGSDQAGPHVMGEEVSVSFDAEGDNTGPWIGTMSYSVESADIYTIDQVLELYSDSSQNAGVYYDQDGLRAAKEDGGNYPCIAYKLKISNKDAEPLGTSSRGNPFVSISSFTFSAPGNIVYFDGVPANANLAYEALYFDLPKGETKEYTVVRLIPEMPRVLSISVADMGPTEVLLNEVVDHRNAEES